MLLKYNNVTFVNINFFVLWKNELSAKYTKIGIFKWVQGSLFFLSYKLPPFDYQTCVSHCFNISLHKPFFRTY